MKDKRESSEKFFFSIYRKFAVEDRKAIFKFYSHKS